MQVSSVELERACVEGVPEIMEAAAVGVPAPGGGPDRLVLFVVLQASAAGGGGQELQKQCQAAIRSRLNPLFRLDKVRALSGVLWIGERWLSSHCVWLEQSAAQWLGRGEGGKEALQA